MAPVSNFQPKDDYELRTPTQEDRELIFDHMKKFFCQDEGMCQSFGKLPEDDIFYEDWYSLVEEAMEQLDLNLLLFHRGKLIGATLNDIQCRDEPQVFTKKPIKSEKFQQMCNILYITEKSSDLFGKYPDCDKIMYMKTIWVETTYRGQGLASILINGTRNLAKKFNCGLLSADCTSFYSSITYKRLGFELVQTYNYDQYKVKGKPYFNMQPPHKAIDTYCLKIE